MVAVGTALSGLFLCRCQHAGWPLPTIDRGLPHPVADQAVGEPELFADLAYAASTVANELHRFSLELPRMDATFPLLLFLGHRTPFYALFRLSVGVHENGSTPNWKTFLAGRSMF